MFTGIIETVGKVQKVSPLGTGRSFWIGSSLTPDLKPDQSVSHNGVCLTVEEVQADRYRVTAVEETLAKSNLSLWEPGHLVNLERCMLMNGRLDGHIVQGHVDQTAILKGLKNANGSWVYTFEYDPTLGNVTVEKGSIAVNGVSLTCFDSRASEFTVAIIPYTFENTNFNQLEIGNVVNLEFDVIGKYVKRLLHP